MISLIEGGYGIQDHDVAAAGEAAGHESGLGEGGRTVVHPGVGDVHAGEMADHGLEVVASLQRALADLGLVWGVGGIELAAARHMVDHAGDVVVVGARTEEAGVVVQVGVLEG